MKLDQVFIKPIAIIDSPFKEKFGIPRQSGLAPSAVGKVRLVPPYDQADAVRGLENFSHLWLLFLFDQHMDRDWTPLIRPPRLGGNEKIGVFASRSTFRPNMIGQSVVKLESVETRNGEVCLTVSGIDLLDQTAIIDIKPYVPYSDALPDADGSFARLAPEAGFDIHIPNDVSADVERFETDQRPNLRALIIEVLQQDPRPAYRKGKQEERIYGVKLFDLDIRFFVSNKVITVAEIRQ